MVSVPQPQVQLSAIGDAVDAFNRGQNQRRAADLLRGRQNAGRIAARGDFDRARNLLLGRGDFEGGVKLADLGKQRQSQARDRRMELTDRVAAMALDATPETWPLVLQRMQAAGLSVGPEHQDFETGRRQVLSETLSLRQVLAQQSKGGNQRRILKDATGRQRFVDTGQPVFPDVDVSGVAATAETRFGKPPAGFRFLRDGSLEPIPGGPATKLPAETAGRVGIANAALARMPQIRDAFLGEDAFDAEFAADYAVSRGKVGRARKDLRLAIEAILRAATGAAAPEAEVRRFLSLFEPTPFDTKPTREAKLNRAVSTLNNLLEAVQRGRVPTAGEFTTPADAAATPDAATGSDIGPTHQPAAQAPSQFENRTSNGIGFRVVR